jgi:hypothetical protein
MEYEDYGTAIQALRNLPPRARVQAYRELVTDAGPLSDWEREMAEKQVAGQTGSRPWMAVAAPGLRVGDMILPDHKAGAASLSITDVPYVAESAFERIGEAEAGIYTVEPRGPVTVDLPAFRLGLFCVIDRTLSEDTVEVSEALVEASCSYRCEAAKVLLVMSMPPETGPRH